MSGSMAKPRLQKKEPHRSSDVPGSGGALRWESTGLCKEHKGQKGWNTAGEGHSDLCMVRLTGLDHHTGSCQMEFGFVWKSICMEHRKAVKLNAGG